MSVELERLARRLGSAKTSGPHFCALPVTKITNKATPPGNNLLFLLRFQFLAIRGGPMLFGEIPRFLGSPYAFWHDNGEPFTNFFSHFHRKVKAIWRWAKASGVDFRPFTFHSLRHSHAIEFCAAAPAHCVSCNSGSAIPTMKTDEEYINSGLLSPEEVQWALFGGHGQGVDFSGASGHKSGHSG